MPLVSFDTPGKYQKTFGFFMFSGGIRRDQWHEMGCLEPNNFNICLILTSSISIIKVKISEMVDWPSEAIKTKF